jgi:hypothetical protein
VSDAGAYRVAVSDLSGTTESIPAVLDMDLTFTKATTDPLAADILLRPTLKGSCQPSWCIAIRISARSHRSPTASRTELSAFETLASRQAQDRG